MHKSLYGNRYGMRKVGWWSLFLAPAWLAAQTVSVDVSPAIPANGRALALIQLHHQTGAQPAALQWTVRLASETGRLQVEPGEQAIAAKKRIECASAADQITCVMWGPNRNLIQDGLVAKVTVSERGSSAPHLLLARVSAVSAEGSSISVQAHPDGSQSQQPRSATSSFLLSMAGIGLLFLVIRGAVYLARSRLAAAR